MAPKFGATHSTDAPKIGATHLEKSPTQKFEGRPAITQAWQAR